VGQKIIAREWLYFLGFVVAGLVVLPLPLMLILSPQEGASTFYEALFVGSALINSHRLAARRPRGARLAVDRSMMSQMSAGLVVSHESADLVVLDWIHIALDEIEEISSRAGIQLLPGAELQDRLLAYEAGIGNTADEDWKRCTLQLNGCGR
jgi:hypothetical protein